MKILHILSWAYTNAPEFIAGLAFWGMVLLLASVNVFFDYDPAWRRPAMLACLALELMCLLILVIRGAMTK